MVFQSSFSQYLPEDFWLYYLGVWLSRVILCYNLRNLKFQKKKNILIANSLTDTHDCIADAQHIADAQLEKHLKNNLLLYSFHCVKVFQIRSFSAPYFPVCSPNTGKYGPENTSYLDTFHTAFNLFFVANLSSIERRWKNLEAILYCLKKTKMKWPR